MPTHIHIVPDYVTLFRLVANCEKQNPDLQRIIDLIQDERLILETSPITANQTIRLIELNCLKCDQKIIIARLLEVVRINSENAIEYQQIFREATEFTYYGSDLIFEDIFNLVFTKQLGTGIKYLTSKKKEIERLIEIEIHNHPEYLDMEIHDLASLFAYLDDQDFWNSSDNIIFVRTPQGDFKRLPIGATAVDFAYKVHTDIGHQCMKAFANGREIPLYQQLEDGQTIQIILNPDGKRPERAWLSFVVSRNAKEKIKKWFKDQNVERGKRLIQANYGSLYAFNGDVYSDVARKLNCKNTLHLFEKLGSGKISIERIHRFVEKYRGRISCAWTRQEDTEQRCLSPIQGINENEQVTLSLCCYPLPKDGHIIGILNQGTNNLRIHSASCKNVLSIDTIKKRELTWNCDCCTAEIQVKMRDRTDILRTILDSIAEVTIKLNVRKVATDENIILGHPAILEFYALVSNKKELETLIEEISSIKDVYPAKIKALYPSSAKFNGGRW